jgi:hypothetical protein
VRAHPLIAANLNPRRPLSQGIVPYHTHPTNRGGYLYVFKKMIVPYVELSLIPLAYILYAMQGPIYHAGGRDYELPHPPAAHPARGARTRRPRPRARRAERLRGGGLDLERNVAHAYVVWG